MNSVDHQILSVLRVDPNDIMSQHVTKEEFIDPHDSYHALDSPDHGRLQQSTRTTAPALVPKEPH